MTSETSVTWRECLNHVKFWRNEVKRSLGEPINKIEIVEESDGTVKLYGLAKTSEDGNAQQNVVYAVLPAHNDSETGQKTLLMRPLFSNSRDLNIPADEKISTELCLFYERMRFQTVNGITHFTIQDNTFLLSSPAHLYTYTTKNKKLKPIATYVDGAALNAAFSPVNCNYVAFACSGQLYIDKHNENVFTSEAKSGVTCGVASFVAQEEFERYEGFWWSPTRVEVLYEKVDESKVEELCFAVPGSVSTANMMLHYPLAGKTNPSSTLMICHINVQQGLVLDLSCQANLTKIVPWYEYLVRSGWTTDGENVWVYVMNRAQTQSALLLLPRIVFCNEVVENAEEFVKILYEEKSNTWINFNNHINFLPNEPDGMLRAIIGSEKRNHCHLYLHIFNITYGDSGRLEEIDENEPLDDFSSPRQSDMITAVDGSPICARTTDALPSLPMVAPNPPPVQIIHSDEVAELADHPPPLPPSVILPVSGERRPSLTARRLSQQIGVLSDQRDLPITGVDETDDWVVYKDASITVDYCRQHVYYLCSKASPTVNSLAVSSYGIMSRECRLLTPEDMCFKYELLQMSLSINPDHGFVCWLSNVNTLPECRFYRLIHKCPSPLTGVTASDSPTEPGFSTSAELPTAIFAYRIGIEMMCSNPLASIMPPPKGQDYMPIRSLSAQKSRETENAGFSRPRSATGEAMLHRPPSSLFNSKIFTYTSKNSGKTHYALLLWPTDAVVESLGCRAAAAIAKTRTGRFPVLQAVYGGPHAQMVKNSWQCVANHMKFLAVGFAVLLVDGRGSANRGVDFEAPIKEAFGTVELEDQVEGLHTVAGLTDEKNLLDLSNVVVTGWSYGGYISVLLLANYPEIYRAACAGGTVFDWTLYDTAYTERYTGDPHEREAQYRASSLQSHLSKLPEEDNRLLLVHGLLDENVHFRHIEKLINGIIAIGKPHQLLLLPGERHSVRNGDAIEYFHTRMLTFFFNALSK